MTATQSNELDHILRLHIIYPAIIRPKPEQPIGYHTITGHVFASLAEAGQTEQFFGFYPAFVVLGSQSVAPEHRIGGISELNKPVRGIIANDRVRQHVIDETLDYPLRPEQFHNVVTELERWRQNPPDYILTQNNCVTFACQLIRTAGFEPPQQLLGIDTPISAGLGMQVERWRRQVRSVICCPRETRGVW